MSFNGYTIYLMTSLFTYYQINKNTSLLGNIGQAHMTRELQKAIDNIKHIVKKEEQELEEKTGIESSFTEEKVQDYMEQVIQEVMSARMSKNNPNI